MLESFPDILRKIICMMWGLSSGIIISMGMVSFITAIGIIPRLLQQNKI